MKQRGRRYQLTRRCRELGRMYGNSAPNSLDNVCASAYGIGMETYNDPRQCPLKNEWRVWPASKRSDRMFMSCPACGSYGSHVGEAAPGVPAAWSPARGWAARARAGRLVSKDMTGTVSA